MPAGAYGSVTVLALTPGAGVGLVIEGTVRQPAQWNGWWFYAWQCLGWSRRQRVTELAGFIFEQKTLGVLHPLAHTFLERFGLFLAHRLAGPLPHWPANAGLAFPNMVEEILREGVDEKGMDNVRRLVRHGLLRESRVKLQRMALLAMFFVLDGPHIGPWRVELMTPIAGELFKAVLAELFWLEMYLMVEFDVCGVPQLRCVAQPGCETGSLALRAYGHGELRVTPAKTLDATGKQRGTALPGVQVGMALGTECILHLSQVYTATSVFCVACNTGWREDLGVVMHRTIVTGLAGGIGYTVPGALMTLGTIVGKETMRLGHFPRRQGGFLATDHGSHETTQEQYHTDGRQTALRKDTRREPIFGEVGNLFFCRGRASHLTLFNDNGKRGGRGGETHTQRIRADLQLIAIGELLFPDGNAMHKCASSTLTISQDIPVSHLLNCGMVEGDA